MEEYAFTVTVYPLTPEKAAELREEIQNALLALVAGSGLFMGPTTMEVVKDDAEKGGK